MSEQRGRRDQAIPLMSWQTKANLTLAGMGLTGLGCWHLSVVLTADGLGLLDVGRSLGALARAHPLTIVGVDTARTGATLAVFGLLAVLVLGVYTAAVFAWYGWRRNHHRGKGLAGRADVRAAVGQDRARQRAKQSRPGLTNRQRQRADVADLALELGREESTGEPVIVSFEDHVAVISPSGGGKSRDVMIPAALSAPGPLMVTSNEVTILDAIAATRAVKGRVWVFDPLERSSWPEPMVWNPVDGCQDGERALSRGHAFAAGLAADGQASTNAGFFQKNASSALTRMLHAAALGQRTMADVLDWAIHLENGAQTPRNIIEGSTDPRAEPLWAGMLASVATGADETVASSRQTLQQAVEPLALRKVLRWVVPDPDVSAFDADRFVRSSDTLVLLSDDNSSTNVGPLCTMIFQEVIDAMKAYAPTAPDQRLDPPLRIVGDEIANVAPIEKLPEAVTEIRKLGCQGLFAFQSPSQAQTRWGERRGQTLLEMMAVEVVLPGLKSTEALRRYSDLVGYVEVAEASTGYDRDGRRHSENTSLRERRIMRPDEIRTIPEGQALVLFKNAPAMLVRLTPWYERPGGTAVAAGAKATARRRAEHKAKRSADLARANVPVPEPADVGGTA